MHPSNIKSNFIGHGGFQTVSPGADAVGDIIGKTKEGTTREQLAALAYSWGSAQSEASATYLQNFETNKQKYLAAAGDSQHGKSGVTFNIVIRAGIKDQLPAEISDKLDDLQKACESKIKLGGSSYGYHQMKVEMLNCIEQQMREQGPAVPNIGSAVPATAPHFPPPPRKATITGSQPQPVSTKPSFVAPPSPASGTHTIKPEGLAVINLSKEKATTEQLKALAYAWDSDLNEAGETYSQDFEQGKAAFLVKAGDSAESRMMFNELVRSGICGQLPAEIATRLLNRQSVSESSMGKSRTYTYANVRADMLACIRGLIQEQVQSVQAMKTASSPTSTTSSTSTTTIAHPPPAAVHPAVVPAMASVSAPTHLKFLDSFPIEWRSRPAWSQIIACMDTYLSRFASYRGLAQRTLLQADPAAVVKAVQSMQLTTSLPAEEAARVAYQREIVNIAMSRPFDETTNEAVLGCKTSRMMVSNAAQTPGNQLSIAMRVPVLTVDARTCKPVILSVSAPALDTEKQPEWPYYVKNGTLDTDAYRVAFQTLAGHIKQCAALPEHKGYQVILSGFGLANFLSGLSPNDREAAEEIGADVMLDLIRELRTKGTEVAYTDSSGSSPPWPEVNEALGSGKLQCVGSIPGQWIKDEQIIVNAWDPHSLVGNGCAKDNSLDGYIGRNSLVHETHALACALHAHGFTN